jgi:hypothetical protein
MKYCICLIRRLVLSLALVASCIPSPAKAQQCGAGSHWGHIYLFPNGTEACNPGGGECYKCIVVIIVPG